MCFIADPEIDWNAWDVSWTFWLRDSRQLRRVNTRMVHGGFAQQFFTEFAHPELGILLYMQSSDYARDNTQCCYILYVLLLLYSMRIRTRSWCSWKVKNDDIIIFHIWSGQGYPLALLQWFPIMWSDGLTSRSKQHCFLRCGPSLNRSSLSFPLSAARTPAEEPVTQREWPHGLMAMIF